MKVLMLGWEFPPYSSGGLGTACEGLTKGLSNQGVNVTFVLPKANGEAKADHVRLIVASNVRLDKDHIKILEVNSLLVPYISSDAYSERYMQHTKLKEGQAGASVQEELYGRNLYEEVHRYSEKVKLIAAMEDFDVIHAHDWMTYPAGIRAKRMSGKPLVCHIHATEFDRTGGNVNQHVYDIEREGFHAADKIVAVSNFTKRKVVEHYGISPDKVEVVHNAVEFTQYSSQFCKNADEKVVLFLGRLTLQKGPEYFLYAARRVLEKDPDVRFIVAGSGDMEAFMIQKAAELGIAHRVLFTGFLRGADIDRAYRMADLYVMPSVSEPFGITPLEAMRNGTPVIISTNSGVSEVISHCLKVDFWDIDQMSSKMLAALNYRTMHSCMRENGLKEVTRFNWNEPAGKVISVYNSVMSS
jgi:glycogen synthase